MIKKIFFLIYLFFAVLYAETSEYFEEDTTSDEYFVKEIVPSSQTLLSFKIKENNKEVLLIKSNKQLYYILKKDEKVEFYYPKLATKVSRNRDFILDDLNQTLLFKNAFATYKIYQKLEKSKVINIGVSVKVNGKKYDLEGDVSTLQSDLSSLNRVFLYNLENRYKKELFFKHRTFTSLKKALLTPEKVLYLNLSKQHLKVFPKEILKLVNLKKLYLVKINLIVMLKHLPLNHIFCH